MVPIGIPRPVLFAVKFAVCPLPSSVPPSWGEESLTKSVARLVSPEPLPLNVVAVTTPVNVACPFDSIVTPDPTLIVSKVDIPV